MLWISGHAISEINWNEFKVILVIWWLIMRRSETVNTKCGGVLFQVYIWHRLCSWLLACYLWLIMIKYRGHDTGRGSKLQILWETKIATKQLFRGEDTNIKYIQDEWLHLLQCDLPSSVSSLNGGNRKSNLLTRRNWIVGSIFSVKLAVEATSPGISSKLTVFKVFCETFMIRISFILTCDSVWIPHYCICMCMYTSECSSQEPILKAPWTEN